MQAGMEFQAPAGLRGGVALMFRAGAGAQAHAASRTRAILGVMTLVRHHDHDCEETKGPDVGRQATGIWLGWVKTGALGRVGQLNSTGPLGPLKFKLDWVALGHWAAWVSYRRHCARPKMFTMPIDQGLRKF